jgi:hypothetical protein
MDSHVFQLHFVYVIDLNIHLLRLQIYSCRVNGDTDITLQRLSNYFLLYFVVYS